MSPCGVQAAHGAVKAQDNCLNDYNPGQEDSDGDDLDDDDSDLDDFSLFQLNSTGPITRSGARRGRRDG